MFSAIARIFGKQSYWVGVGIGPLRTRIGSLVTKVGLALQCGCSVRDRKTMRTIERLNVQKTLIPAFDLAALLVPDQQIARATAVLGVSLTWTAESERGEVPLDEIVAKALSEELDSERAWIVRVFIIRGGEREDDRKISSRFKDRLQALLPDQAIEILPYSSDPEVTLNRIAACSHFIATRFHSAVFAYVGKCRMMVIEYHRKLSDFADDIGLGKEFVVAHEEVETIDIVRCKIRNCLSEGLSQGLLPIEEARALADRNFSFFR